MILSPNVFTAIASVSSINFVVLGVQPVIEPTPMTRPLLSSYHGLAQSQCRSYSSVVPLLSLPGHFLPSKHSLLSLSPDTNARKRHSAVVLLLHVLSTSMLVTTRSATSILSSSLLLVG